MNPEEEALRVTLDLLDRIGIPYMVTGSVAASYHGRPRTTHDADLVIDPSPDQLTAFVQALTSAGFYNYVSRWAVVLGVDDLWRRLWT